ncbi:MAG: H/ACA ribonucleoprotein complex subunit GAR1 [Haloferacaceae archaeon]
MRRLGTVDRIAQGLAIVRADPDGGTTDDDPPEIGTTAVDESLATVGRVVDVFGPVGRHYLALDPADGVDPAGLLGSPLYAR